MRKKDTKRIPTILYVEDGKFVSHAYKEGLEEEGFSVVTAFNGIEAMEKMRLQKPDIVLMDLIIPQKSGFEVLEEMRMEAALQHIPVIVLTDLDTGSDIEKAMSLGVLSYLVKSRVSMKDVVASIKQGLRKKR